jgi:hypothetical protein
MITRLGAQRHLVWQKQLVRSASVLSFAVGPSGEVAVGLVPFDTGTVVIDGASVSDAGPAVLLLDGADGHVHWAFSDIPGGTQRTEGGPPNGCPSTRAAWSSGSRGPQPSPRTSRAVRTPRAGRRGLCLAADGSLTWQLQGGSNYYVMGVFDL